jgi:hypothetical protein
MTSPPMGGAGEIVEVDETVFGKQDGVTMVTLLPIIRVNIQRENIVMTTQGFGIKLSVMTSPVAEVISTGTAAPPEFAPLLS